MSPITTFNNVATRRIVSSTSGATTAMLNLLLTLTLCTTAVDAWGWRATNKDNPVGTNNPTNDPAGGNPADGNPATNNPTNGNPADTNPAINGTPADTNPGSTGNAGNAAQPTNRETYMTATMLIGSTTFVMLLFYLLNHPRQQLQR